MRLLTILLIILVAFSSISGALPAKADVSYGSVPVLTFAQPAKTLITQFQTGHGWGKTGDGLASDDSTVYCRGTQSLKCTTSSENTSYLYITKTLPANIDLSDKVVRVLLKVEDTDPLASPGGMSLFVMSTGKYALMPMTTMSRYYTPGGVWYELALSRANVSTDTGVDWTQIYLLQFRFNGNGGGKSLVVWLQEISYHEPIISEPTVSFIFDGPYDDQYDNAYPILDAAGFTATLATIPHWIDGEVSSAELLEMQADGWDIASHWDVDFTTLSEAEIESTVISIQDDLESGGFDGWQLHTYAQYGTSANTVMPIMRRYYISGRVNAEATTACPPGDFITMESHETSGSSNTTIYGWLTNAITHNAWLRLGFHHIDNEGGTGHMLVGEFQCVVDNVTSSGVRVMNVADVLEEFGGATAVTSTTANVSADILASDTENVTERGFDWGTDPHNFSENWTEVGNWQYGNFQHQLTGLSPNTKYYVRARAYNSDGWGYAMLPSFTTAPGAPTNVSATDGDSTENVTVTWTKSDGATDYQVYRGDEALGWLGDVATYTDTGAGVPYITAGSAVASDGTYVDHVALSLSGTSTNNGATHTYKVRAKNEIGESPDSDTDTGYRGVGSLSYQWQRSAADSDADYSNIVGATTVAYNDTGAPENGDGRYYQCVLNATGATENTSASDRGYRDTASPPTVTNTGASAITDDSARLNGSLNDGGATCNITYYWDTIDYGESENWTYSATQTGQVTGVVYYNVSGTLTSETTYFFIIRAINETGEDWSATANFTTTEESATTTTTTSSADMTEVAEAIEGLTGAIESIHIFELVMILSILAISTWKRDIIFYVVSGIVIMIMAITLIDSYTGIAVVLVCLSLYELYTGLIMALSGGQSRGLSQFRGLINKVRGRE